VRRPSTISLAAGGLLASALLLWAVTASTRSDAKAPATAAAPSATAPPSRRPTEPPRPGDPHPRVAEPSMPSLTPAWRREVTDRVKQAPQPGAQAFRAMSDLYVEHNADLAQAQADAERITLAEVRELTYLGLMVQATQRVDEVEDVLGRALDQPARDQLTALMNDSNHDFQRQLRELVATGRPEDARWQLIRATEAHYLERYLAITGMMPDELDALLGGNILLPGAPIAGGETPPPEPRDQPRDTPTTPSRPTAP
jgi:hypothetical protein